MWGGEVYRVKEIFYTLQGEGLNTGRPAVFCRFSGCNLWSGREEDRGSAVCTFCDTDFIGGDRYETAEDLAGAVTAKFPYDSNRFVVLTGGEPMLQVDKPLIDALKSRGFYVAIETNGTIPVTEGIDWVTVSPKSEVVVRSGDELKFVYPQNKWTPQDFEELNFKHFIIQPNDGAWDAKKQAVQFCMSNPKWRLMLQSHKVLGIA